MLGEIRNRHGERLDYSFAESDRDDAQLIVIGHGVTANKDREWALTLANALQAEGFASLRFSFSGNGESEGDFRDSNPSKEVEDLGAVLDRCEAWAVTYVGHSMGGAVGVLRASADERVTRLVSLAGMVDTAGFARRKFGDLQAGRDCMWGKPECPLSRKFLEDMDSVGSVEGLAGEIRVPWLLVHGTADNVVPFEESESIARRAAGSVELFAVDGADHVFSGGASGLMAARVCAWLRETDPGSRGGNPV